MKLANLNGRATIVTGRGVVDIAKASDETLPSDPDQAIAKLAQIRTWYDSHQPQLDSTVTSADLLAEPWRLGPPVTAPRQIFAIGLNYADHGAETGRPLPEKPLVFTKFASALSGPGAVIPLPTETCDWEVELVVVIGQAGRHITEDEAFEHVAGFCIGQDISERPSQLAGAQPQFSIAKSHAGFGPIGPWLTTLDELPNPTDLAIETKLDDELVQFGRTGSMIFGIATLISYLSQTCELMPGDLIFTGTPAGVGNSRTPPRFLTPGITVHSTIEGLGELHNLCAAT